MMTEDITACLLLTRPSAADGTIWAREAAIRARSRVNSRNKGYGTDEAPYWMRAD